MEIFLPEKVKLGNFHYSEVKSRLVLKNLSGIYFTFPPNGHEEKRRERNCCSHIWRIKVIFETEAKS